MRGNLSSLVRKTLQALVVMDVHARDVVTHLAQQKVTDIADFAWQSQLRYTYSMNGVKHNNGDIESLSTVSMINATLEYGYEYLGNSSR